MHFDAAGQNKNEFLARVPKQLTKFSQRPRMRAAKYWNHPFLAQVGTQKIVVVIRRIDANSRVQCPNAAPCHYPGFGGVSLGEQLREPHSEPLADLQELIVAECELVFFDLGEC